MTMILRVPIHQLLIIIIMLLLIEPVVMMGVTKSLLVKLMAVVTLMVQQLEMTLAHGVMLLPVMIVGLR